MFSLSGLFQEGDPTHDEVEGLTNSEGTVSTSNKQIPVSPRLSCGLCGIQNQGATCYLNSLLQTLVMTPEFRVSLFQLGPKELGVLGDKEKQSSKVRVIPLQLQALFSQLLLLNTQATSTTNLTDSFGWTNKEELVQQDVQELNRILFSAIEDSLVATSGQDMIQKLYHGSVVNQIVCQVCGKISEREEDFLDLCVAVAGSSCLEDSLMRCYVDTEALDGNNRYHCDACNKLVDAKKGAKIRHLPPLLTISLLRFSFDYQKLERFKETGKFCFPLEIDLAPYVESLLTAGNTEYELYSAVNHSGGAHGGHYTACIRDINNLGHWTNPDDEMIQLAPDPSSGKVDFIECDSPVDLVQALLRKTPEKGMPVDKLCAEINKQTGVSWNKRFKRQYGPINKFLRKYDDKFTVSEMNHVQLLAAYHASPGKNDDSQKNGCEPHSGQSSPSVNKSNSPQSPIPKSGHCWFEYNDSHIRPVRPSHLEKQYSGKSSAYMLFYRRKESQKIEEAISRPEYMVPKYLIQQIEAENKLLEQQRKAHEIDMNTIMIKLVFSQLLMYEHGALQVKDNSLSYLELAIDKRKTISQLDDAVRETYGELMPTVYVIHYAKLLPSGVHPYHCVSVVPDVIISDVVVDHKCRLLVWDGKQINGEEIPIGLEKEPIQLSITHGDKPSLLHGFPKSLTLGELRLMMCSQFGLDPETTTVNSICTNDADVKITRLLKEDNGKTLEEIDFKNGEKLILENSFDSARRAPRKTSLDGTDMVSYKVENRCTEDTSDDSLSMTVKIHHNATVKELKSLIVSQLSTNHLDLTKCRLRPDDDNLGLLPPISETQSLSEAGLRSNSRIILERGLAPLTDQLSLTFAYTEQGTDLTPLEVIVGRNTTVCQLLHTLIERAGKEGDEWHLRRTNWCREAAGLLDDLDKTLVECQLQSGDHLLLEEGELPPKGFLKLQILLFPATSAVSESNKSSSGLMSWIHGLLGSRQDAEVTNGDGPVDLGSVVVAKDSILEDLKLIVLTLPKMENLPIPTVDFLRLRLVERNHLTSILKDHKLTLQRLKVTNDMTLGVQLLQEEENLSNQHVVIEVKLRIPGTRDYKPSHEIIWDTSQGTTLATLRQVVADCLVLPAEKLILAKYVQDKYEWIVLEETSFQSKGRKGKKSHQPKINLRQAPYHIKDGAVIGVVDLAGDPLKQDDFSTESDISGREQIRLEAEERKKKREDMKAAGMTKGSQFSPQRKELSIKIHVDDFR